MKKQLRHLLIDRSLAHSPGEADALILAGKVRVNDIVSDKAGASFESDAEITVEHSSQYVSRGGDKLAGALRDFKVSVTGLACSDVGAATGGFTDALLQAGARHVYAVDVGYGDLAWKVRSDARVTLLERTNAKDVTSLPESVSLIAMDVSFTSVRNLIPTIRHWLTPEGKILLLFKPQFEAAREDVPPGGVILDRSLHEKLLTEFSEWCEKNRLAVEGPRKSAVKGGDGNQEFFFLIQPQSVQSSQVKSENAR